VKLQHLATWQAVSRSFGKAKHTYAWHSGEKIWGICAQDS
jgi:hypothetical protein